jgi:hypothetical protein
MPARGELQISMERPGYRLLPRNEIWCSIVAAIKNPEFLMIVLFCAVGLWLTFYLMNFCLDFGEIAGSLM